MTSRQLDYFSTIAECQNFSAAARKLYVSQPAISQQIQVLEEEIGYPLIHRTRHHVELTEYGQIFLQFCQKLKDDYTDLCDSMYELKICRDYRDGKVTKEELDKCSTCDMCAVVNNGLSEASKEQLKHKTGEEIVDADIAQQMETK